MRIIDWFQHLSFKRQEAVLYSILIAAVLAVYSNVYYNEFVLDDIVLILQNKFLREWQSIPDIITNMTEGGAGRLGGFYRPVQILFYLFVYQLFGPSTVAFHALNVIFHAVNAVLVYRLGTGLRLLRGASFAAALLWAVHPLHTEGVTYMSATADSLFTLFCLAGILALLPDFSPRRILWSGLFFVLALGTKESAAIFPGLVAACLFLMSKDRLKPTAYLKTWPFWIGAAIYMVLLMFSFHINSSLAMHDPEDVFYFDNYANNIFNRIITCLASLPVYLRLIMWPTNLHMEYALTVHTAFWSWDVLAGFVMVAVALWQIIWGKGRRGLALSWGLLWFAAAHAPNTGIIMPIAAMIAEHWMYLPSIGLALGVSHTVGVWLQGHPGKKFTHMACIGVLLGTVAFGVTSFVQNRVWRTPFSFYLNVFECGERSGRAHDSLAQIYWVDGDFESAIKHQLAAIDHPAPLLKARLPDMHFRLGLIYLRTKPAGEQGLVTIDEVQRALPFSTQIPEAIEQFHQALALAPNFTWARQFADIAESYLKQQDKESPYHNWLRSKEN